ncbi:MAG: N-acetylmuramoyl-L-alanine amidase, partial [Flavobacteriales bacterium]|nr:N-acetylmuramoyl-L-alanine amidase [Flavobacteriales bacterium]
MKKILFLFAVIFTVVNGFSQSQEIQANYKQEFDNVYAHYPNIPDGILEAVAFTNTRVRHIFPEEEMPSCIGLPYYYGVMGLVADGKGYFRNSLDTIASLAEMLPQEIKNNPQKNIEAFAKSFDIVAQSLGINSNRPEDYIEVLRALSELPLTRHAQNDFALNSHLYMVFRILNDVEFQVVYGLPAYNIDIRLVFGAGNYGVLSATQIDIENDSLKSNTGQIYQVSSGTAKALCNMPTGPNEYPTAIWDAADASNYSGTISPYTVAIHTVQGSYAGAISWFKNPSANVSAHYTVRSYDGQVTQQVCHTRKGWHVASENAAAVGIEHEGYINDGDTWYSNALYLSSANLTTFICNDRGIDMLQCYDGEGINGILTLSHTCHKIKGHQSFAGNSHVDPGEEWDWERYYRLLNGTPPLTNSSTASSGTMYDSGGSVGNYADEERTSYSINPTGTAPVQLTFSNWNVESGWDYLWIYEGTDNTGSLIGKYSGTSPGLVTAWSGQVFMEFRSDCSTNMGGWQVDWTTISVPICVVPTGLMEVFVTPMSAELGWDVVSGATDYKVRYKSTQETNWTEVYTTGNTLEITGLISNDMY